MLEAGKAKGSPTVLGAPKVAPMPCPLPMPIAC